MTNPEIVTAVVQSLHEDIGSGDITAALIPANARATARIITREAAILAGQPWVTEVYRQLDPQVQVYWLAREGDAVVANQPLALLRGPARSLLSGERAALNWLQTLSGTATQVAAYVAQLQRFNTKLLDTRKTIPGLRYAQKYAVRLGGGVNHRMGLYDAFLIKENHIAAAGSISRAVATARAVAPGKPIEVEVEDLTQLAQAIAAKVDTIMLDNFSVEQMHAAVAVTQGRVPLEVSGQVTLKSIASIAATGVDFISVGALTKHVRAIDLSMRIIDVQHF